MYIPDNPHSLKFLKEFPMAPAGYEDVHYKIDDLDLEVTYQCYDDQGQLRNGKLVFEFFVAMSIESETNSQIKLPVRSGVLYNFESKNREGFRGYQIWFSDNHLISVVCKQVLIENEVY